MAKRKKKNKKQSPNKQPKEEVKKEPEKKETKSESSESLYLEVADQFKVALEAMEPQHAEFEEKEKILLGVANDKLTNNSTRSKIYDPTLATAVLKQNNQVMAQLPTGKVQALTKDDRGKSMMMDFVLQNYVIPNANTQYDIYTKLWLLSLYRKVYGTFGVLVDYVDSDKYTGADFSLIPARSLIPQKGRTSVEDADYMFVRSMVSKKWLEERTSSVWKNIDKVVELDGKPMDTDFTSYAEDKYDQDTNTSKSDLTELITRYGGDRWVTFSKDAKCILRDIPNPQKNGEIPIVVCHAYPLIDRFFGLGEFERGKTLHYAQNSLINLYMDGVKMSIFPPLKIDLDNVVARTIKNEPGAKWVMRNGRMNAVEEMQRSPSGLNTFQSTYGFLKGAVLSLTNTSDTSISSSVDTGMGKSQRYSEPVLTPGGWVSMGDIKEYDYVIDDKGQPATVLEIHEQGEIGAYEIFFNDGTKTSCSLDHLWTVYNTNNHGKKFDRTLKEIIDYGLYHPGYGAKSGGRVYNFKIDLPEPVEFIEQEVSIHPYLLGLLLGDGGFTESPNRISFTNSKSYIIEAVKRLLPDDSEIYLKNNGRDNEFRIRGSIVDTLKSMGLYGHKADTKFIPKEYIYNSIDVREQILQGLIDTDGYTVKHSGGQSVEYATVSKQLADDFTEVARGLGKFAKITEGISARYEKEYGSKYRIYIPATRTQKTIINIKTVSPENSRCLFVDTPNHLYVTNGYTLTHNTPQALKMQQMDQAQKTGFDRKMLEISLEKIYNKMIDVIANRQEKPIEMHVFGKAELEKIAEYNEDVLDMFDSGEAGKITVNPKHIKDTKYRFFINSSSTMQKDEVMENQTIMGLIEMLMKVPGFSEQIAQTGEFQMGDKKLVLAEMIKRFIDTAGLADTEKMIVDNEQDPGMNEEGQNLESVRQELAQTQFQDPDIAQVFQELSGQPPQGQPQQPMPQQPMPQQPMPGQMGVR